MNKNDQEFLVQKIRTQYTEKEHTGLDELKELDLRVKHPANVFAYIFGSINTDKTVRLAISTTKLTARTICRALSKYLQHRKNKKANKAVKDDHIKGKQSVKQLIGQNQGVSSLPVGETGLKDFERIAKKYGVDFAIVKDKTVTPTKYMVFFKARDADAIAQVLAEYTAKQMKKQSQNRPSILKALKKFKELVANMPKKEHEKKKEKSR